MSQPLLSDGRLALPCLRPDVCTWVASYKMQALLGI